MNYMRAGLPQQGPQVVHMVPKLDNTECCRGLYLALSPTYAPLCYEDSKSETDYCVLVKHTYLFLLKNLMFSPSPSVIRAVHRKSEL